MNREDNMPNMGFSTQYPVNNVDSDGRGCRLLHIPTQDQLSFQMMTAHTPVDGDDEGNGKSKKKEGLRKGKWTVSLNSIPKSKIVVSIQVLLVFH